MEEEIQAAHAVEWVQAEAPEAANDMAQVLPQGEEVETEAPEEVKWLETEVRRVDKICSVQVAFQK